LLTIKKFIKYTFLYLLYYPITNTEYRRSLINILIFKLKYEKQNTLCFYDSTISQHSFSHLLIDRYTLKEKVVLFAGDPDHPAFKSKNPNLITIYLNRDFKILFLLLNIKLLITFSSGFPKVFKRNNMHLVHLFHSLVSINFTYDTGSFDAYDTFFAVGPHHIEELNTMSRIRNWKDKTFLKVGYPKLQKIVRISNKDFDKKEKKTIIFAPSWGEQNALRLHGLEIAHRILRMNYELIIRPHPLSFKYDKNIINQLLSIVEQHSDCYMDNPDNNSFSSLLKADLMISDYSGVAYEYAFGLLRPVLFLDTPPKINNNSEIEKQKAPMENTSRDKIGKICNITELESSIHSILSNPQRAREIEVIREKYLFNPRNSIDIAIDEINKLKALKMPY